MSRILSKHLIVNIKTGDKHHSLNIGLILAVVITSIVTWVLTEYLVFQLDNMNRDYFWNRPLAQAVLDDGIPMPDITEVVSPDDLSPIDEELDIDANLAFDENDSESSDNASSSASESNLFDQDNNSPDDGQGDNQDNGDNPDAIQDINPVAKTKLEIYKDYFGGTTDTDNDGLPNDKEINIYKTDPNKADTDGDGYIDGEEVYNSYSPLQKTIIPDKNLANRLKGKILLQSQERGEAWYIYPKNQKRYYLGRPNDAFDIMRNLGLGITDKDLAKIPKNTDAWTDKTGIADKLVGQIVLQVEKNGEAYYINPTDKKRYYLGRPNDAFDIMRNLGLGITFNDLVKIER